MAGQPHRNVASSRRPGTAVLAGQPRLRVSGSKLLGVAVWLYNRVEGVAVELHQIVNSMSDAAMTTIPITHAVVATLSCGS